MKHYKYNITTNFNTVTAEIYHTTKNEEYDVKLQIHACSKSFSGGFIGSFRNYPLESQFVEAEKWAIEQCRIMNKYK